MDSASEDSIRRAQHGDREAFSRLLEEHYALILRFAMKYCGNRPDAEDVAQQACIKLARNLSQYRFESAFSTWLYRLVVNCALDWLRSHRDSGAGEAPEAAVEDNAEATVMLHQVLARVGRMGEGYREALVLVMGEGMSHAEAAAVLEVKESTISWRLHEIRKRLRSETQAGVDV